MTHPRSPGIPGAKRMASSPDHCCAHRALDHNGRPLPGSRCTMPDCPCKGWVPRENVGRKPIDRAKIMALWNDGLTVQSIVERLGASDSLVRKAINDVTGARPRRNDAVSIRTSPKRCEVLPTKRRSPRSD